MGIANEAPDENFPENGMPRLTVRMAARIQSFPDEWEFAGKKTTAYRQVGNAFPPMVARAVGLAIRRALNRQRIQLNGTEHAAEMRLLEEHKQRKTYVKAKRIETTDSGISYRKHRPRR
jgi:DNA (cytosine-5)-methyltransferase 1